MLGDAEMNVPDVCQIGACEPGRGSANLPGTGRRYRCSLSLLEREPGFDRLSPKRRASLRPGNNEASGEFSTRELEKEISL